MAGAVRGTRGAWGEDYAAAYLRRHGYRILARLCDTGKAGAHPHGGVALAGGT